MSRLPDDFFNENFHTIADRLKREGNMTTDPVVLELSSQQSYLRELGAAQQEEVLRAIQDAILRVLHDSPGHRKRVSELISEVSGSLYTPGDNVRAALLRLLSRGLIERHVGPEVVLRQ